MFYLYRTVWTAVFCMLIAHGEGQTDCSLHEFQTFENEYQGKKIVKAIRHHTTTNSLLKCLSACNSVGISNVFYNQDTQDCICPLARPRPWLLVNGPGYVYYNAPGLTDEQIQVVFQFSSEQPGYPAGNVIGGSAAGWKPKVDDAQPWIEFGVRLFLYLEELRIHKDMSLFTTSIWLRDGDGRWIKTWTRGDGSSAHSDWFFPSFQLLTVRTDAIRLTFDNPSSVEIRFIRVVGRQ